MFYPVSARWRSCEIHWATCCENASATAICSPTRIGPAKVCFAAGPQAIEEIFQDRAKYFTKSSQYRAVRLFLGDGLVAADGKEWVKQRQTVKPAFRKQVIESFAEAMVHETHVQLDRWTGRAAVDLCADMGSLALRIVGSTVISTESDFESLAPRFVFHRRAWAPVQPGGNHRHFGGGT